MAVLEQVTQMKQKGIPEYQIITSLREQGVSPKEINEALSQSNIKNEVTSQEAQIQPENQINPQNTNTGATQSISENTQMQPSIMSTATQNISPPQRNHNPQQIPSQQEQPFPQSTPQQQYPQSTPQQQYPQQPVQQPMTQEYSQAQELPPPSPESPPEYYPPEQTYSEQQYPEYEEYPQQDYGYDYPEHQSIDTINEIADQITEEKISKIKKEISSVSRFKQEASSEIDRINKRLEKIENTLHEMQIAILRKVGEYGENIKNISDELKATQKSFSKLADPIINHKREHNSEKKESHSKKEHESKTSSHSKESSHHHKGKPKKSKEGFESYLR